MINKKSITSTIQSPLLQHVEKALILIKGSIFKLKATFEQKEVNDQRKLLLQTIRGLQVLRRSAKTGNPVEKLSMLQIESYLDIVIHSLQFNFDTSRDLLQKMQSIALDVLTIHVLDSPLVDHGIAAHDKIFENLKALFKNSTIYKDLTVVTRIASFLYDLSFSQYNARILMFDPNVVFIVQNILFLQAQTFENQEYQVLQAYDYVIGLLQRLTSYEGFPAQLQFLYSNYLIRLITDNDLQEELAERVGDLLIVLFQNVEIFFDQKADLQRLVETLTTSQNSTLIDIKQQAQLIVDSLLVQE